MKKPESILSFLLASVCCALYAFSYAGDAHAQDPVANWPYRNPTGDQFPISAQDLCPEPSRLTAQDLKRLEDCGFNIVQFGDAYGDPSYVSRLAEGTGLRLDVQVPEDCKMDSAKCAVFIRKWKDLPRVCMFDFGDENKMGYMRGFIRPDFDTVRKIGMSQLPIFNRAVFDTKEVDGAPYGVPQELEELQQLLHPAVWCYDYYPVFQVYAIDERSGKKIPEGQPYFNANMFKWLEYYRENSRSTGRPFWYYVLSMEYETPIKDKDGSFKGQYLHRPVTEDFMRFSTFSALAYGAKGLRFWTYSMLQSRSYETYLEAPIDNTGHTTRIWQELKNVISEVRRFNDLFLNSKVEHIYHSGKRNMASTVRQPDCVGPFRTLTSGEKGVLTSLMTYDGKYYMLIVNHDILNSQKMRATAAKGIKVRDLTAGAKKFSSKSSYTFTLQPGGYVLLEYNRNDAAFRPL